MTGTPDGGDPSHLMPSSINSNNPVFIRAQINGTYRNIILDTGSGTTIIHHGFLTQIQHKHFRSIPASYSSANCTELEILGEVDLEIRINHIATRVTAAVAKHLVTDVLLGTDWINQYVTSLDIFNQILSVHDSSGHSTTTPLLRAPPSPAVSPVLLIDSITVPQYSTCPVSVTIALPDSSNVLFEPSTQLNRPALAILGSLLTVTNQQATLFIENHTDRPYTLPQNTRLGTASPPSTICTMSSSSSLSAQPPSSTVSSPSPSPHICYVCQQVFLSNNDLHRHLRTSCYPTELAQQIDSLTTHIESPTHRTRVQDALWKYGKLFDTRHPSKIDFTLEHAIDTGNHRPVYTTPYRRSPKDHETLTMETAKLLQAEQIEPSTSPWCSPVVLIRKKDGGTRFCVDYRKLNEATVKDSFPLPRIDDIFDQLSQSTYFTKLDFKNGYFQIPLAPDDRPKTAFSTRDNHYQFTVLPQGVKNGPPTFQRIVNQILGPARWKYCLAYIDDVLIFSKTLEDHINHLTEILRLLHSFNFRLSVHKCTFISTHIDFLGHHIHNGQIRPLQATIRGLMETPVPSTPAELFRFVKAAEYYRKFIPNFSRIAGPLYKYAPSSRQPSDSKVSGPFKLSSEEQSAFDELKHLLTTDLVLQLPNFDLPFKIQTDASKLGVGAVLLQPYPEGYRPVCYLSKKLSPSQQRWPTIEQECFAVISAIEQWHHYLHGRQFIVESDHQPLESFTKKPQLNDKCERWRLKLQSYDFTVHHIKGASNTMPDYLSRSPVDPPSDDLLHDDMPTFTTTGTQTTDDFLPDSPILSSVNVVTTRSRARHAAPLNLDQSTISVPDPPPLPSIVSLPDPPPIPSTISVPDSPLIPPTDIPSSQIDDLRINYDGDLAVLKDAQQLDSNIQHIIRHIDTSPYSNSYLLTDGLLMHHGPHSKPVPCVPAGSIRSDILKIYHDTAANGAHFGRDKTLRKIQSRYYWNTLSSDVTDYVKSCLRCNQNNPIRHKPAGHLRSIEPPEGVWQLLAMDFHGPISPTSRRGNKYIISLTDVLSKFVITKAVRDCTADTAARFLQEDVICKYGTPRCILTDNGTHFTAHMMEKLFQRLGIIHLYCTPYHPQTNGQIERFNSTMDSKIASLSNQSRTDWDDQLPYVTFNYNTSHHATTQLPPFELMYGRTPVLPCDPQHPMVSLQIDPHHSHQLQQHISSLTEHARHNIISAQRTSKARFDQHRPDPTYQINDLVLIKTIQHRHKFDVRHEGPYRILQRLAHKTYIVQHVQLPHLTRQVTVDAIIPLFHRSLRH